MLLKLGWYWTPKSGWQYGSWKEILDGKLYARSDSWVEKFLKSQDSKEGVRKLEIIDFSQKIVFPGFINSHCHLELSALKGQIPSTQSFSAWVGALQSKVSTWSEEDWVQSYHMGLQEALATGTTRILDVANRDWWSLIENYEGVLIRLQKELIGVDPRKLPMIQSANENVKQLLIPHAPFSCSPDLIRWIVQRSDWLNIHLSESKEELDFFQKQSGPLWDFVKMIYPEITMSPCSGYHYLLEQITASKDVPKNVLLTHGNTLTTTEIKDAVSKNFYIAHCPQSRKYFEHPQQDWPSHIEAGLKLCLGTDSLASSPSLSLWDEALVFYQEFPEVDDDHLYQMLTLHPSEILNLPLEGNLEDGSWANLQIIEPWGDLQKAPMLSELQSHPKVKSVMIQGKFYE